MSEERENPVTVGSQPLVIKKVDKEHGVVVTRDINYSEALSRTELFAEEEIRLVQDKEDEYKKTVAALKSGIETLQKSISKAREDSFAQKPPLALKQPEKADEDAMGPGAGRYLSDLLFGKDALGIVGKEDQRQIISRIEPMLPVLVRGDVSELGQLNPGEIEELSGTLLLMLTQSGHFDEAYAKKGAYWEYFLDRALAGRTPDSYEGYRQKREMDRLAAGVYLAGCEEYEKTERWHLRIRGLSGDNGKGDDAATRGRDRLTVMQELTGILKTLFESNDLLAPQSIYQFRDELRRAEPGIGSAAVKSKYKKYLEEQFKLAGKLLKKDKLDTKLVILDKTYDSWSSLCAFVKENYSLYGVDHDAQVLADVMGDDMSEKSHDTFLEKVASLEYRYHDTVQRSDISKSRMVTDEMKHYLARALYIGDVKFINDSSLYMRIMAADRKGCRKKTERLNSRLKAFKEKNGELLIGTLLSDQRFLEHIVADEESEYEQFIKEIGPALDDVLKELKGHAYFDQYLLERKSEICEFIMTHKTPHSKPVLKLDELDGEIEKVKIGGKTFGDILRERIGADQKALQKPDEKVRSAAEMVDAIALMGAEAVLDDRVKKEAESKRAKRNEAEKQLSEEEKKRKTAELQKKAAQLNQLKKEAEEGVVYQKKKGREFLNRLFSDTQSGFKELDAEQFLAQNIDPAYSAGLESMMHQAEFYMNDPFLETFYSTMVKKLILDVYHNFYDAFLSDLKAVLNIRAFSVAADIVIAERGNITEREKTPLKLGLFEMYAEELLPKDRPGDVENYADKIRNNPGTVEDYAEKIRNTLSQKNSGGLELIGFIKDDRGGITGIGYDYARGESLDGKKAREVFEEQLQKRAYYSTKESFRHMTEDEKLLMFAIMHNRRAARSAKKILTKLTQKPDDYDVGDGDNTAFIQYLKGEPLNEAVMGIDYQGLAKSLTLENSWAEEAEYVAVMVNEVKRVREINSKFVDVKEKKEVLDEADVRAQLGKALEDVSDYMWTIKEDGLMSGKEKMWKLYTILRAYSPVFDSYKKLVNQGILPYVKGEYAGMSGMYEKLAEYFSVGEQKEEIEKMIYRSNFCRLIGIYDEKDMSSLFLDTEEMVDDKLIARKMNEDKSKTSAAKCITDYLDKKTGVKHRPKRRVTDPGENLFPPEVVEGAKAVDRWIASSVRKWCGDSSADFGLEILEYPLRERLFVYYLIENGKEEMPSELDCAMALTGYVPNLAGFTEKMTNNLLYKLVSLAKATPTISDLGDTFGVIDSIGAYATSKLETCMRILDSTRWKFADFLQKLTDDRKDYSDRDLPREVKLRQSLYISLMEEIAKQRILMNGRTKEEASEDPEIMRQDQRLKRLFRKLLRANDAVARLMQDEETVAKYRGMNEVLPWKFDGDQPVDLMKNSGLITLLSAFYVVSAGLDIQRIKAGEGKSAQQIVRYTADFVGNMAGFIDSFTPFGQGIMMLSSAVKEGISADQREQVSDSKEESRVRAENTKETLRDEPGHEHDISLVKGVENIASMQMNMSDAEMKRNMLKTVECGLSILTVLTGGGFLVLPAIEEMIKVTRWITTFWDGREHRTRTIDEFLELDELVEQFKREAYGKLDEVTRSKYGSTDDEIKKTLRQQVLGQMHFSTVDQFFEAISIQYATMIHWYIFYDENKKMILDSQKDKIEQREPFCRLFPGLTFRYPASETDRPSPRIDDIAANLIRPVN